MEATNECPVMLECHLHSQSEGNTEVKYLSLPALPHTVLELKGAVQQQFSIPACVQTVAYQTEVLADDVQLSSRFLRSGDTVDVMFFCYGDCSSIEEVNVWMKELIQAYEECELERDGGEHKVDMIVYNGLQKGLDSALGYDLFEWLVPRTMVNKAYFECSGGLTLLLKLYHHIFSREWSRLRVHQKYLESVCTQAFANYGETASLRRKLIKMGLLDLCFKSMLRVSLSPNMPVSDPFSPAADQEINDSILKAELDNALHLLCWYDFPWALFYSFSLLHNYFLFLNIRDFSELPECQLPIASRSDILRQTVHIALSPSYSCPTAALSSEVFLCLAHTPATHQYLASDYVISGILKTLQDRPSMVDNSPAGLSELVGLKCFTLQWMAILILQSPLTLPVKNEAQLNIIRDHMTDFVANTKTEAIRKYESDRGTIWATLLPYVKQAYLPNSPTTLEGMPLLTELQLLSLRVILLFLHSKVSMPMYHTLLVKENLLDFLVCLSWHIPPSCHPEAIALSSELCSSMPGLGPPRLCNLAKARLAKLHLGLEQVLKMSVGEIASYFYTKH